MGFLQLPGPGSDHGIVTKSNCQIVYLILLCRILADYLFVLKNKKFNSPLDDWKYSNFVNTTGLQERESHV